MRGRSRVTAAIFTLAGSSSNECLFSGDGLATQSKAPISSALMVASAPLLVSVETMITGIGRSRMIFSRNSRPSIFGISTSSVMTSGLSALMASRASSGLLASPTTLMAGSLDSAAAIMLRMVAESSTTRTRTGFICVLLPAAGRW